MIAEFSPEDIYNADETGFYYRALPEHTYVFKNENARGVKTCKQRITLLFCASMSGEKKEPLAIGTSKTPHCFKKVKKITNGLQTQCKRMDDSNNIQRVAPRVGQKVKPKLHRIDL